MSVIILSIKYIKVAGKKLVIVINIDLILSQKYHCGGRRINLKNLEPNIEMRQEERISCHVTHIYRIFNVLI